MNAEEEQLATADIDPNAELAGGKQALTEGESAAHDLTKAIQGKLSVIRTNFYDDLERLYGNDLCAKGLNKVKAKADKVAGRMDQSFTQYLESAVFYEEQGPPEIYAQEHEEFLASKIEQLNQQIDAEIELSTRLADVVRQHRAAERHLQCLAQTCEEAELYVNATVSDWRKSLSLVVEQTTEALDKAEKLT